MKGTLRVLVVDDHPMTILGYTTMMNSLESDFYFDIDSALNCDDVLEKIKRCQALFYDIVFLDIRIPPASDGSVLCGESLGLKIRRKFNNTKIIVHTALIENVRIFSILNSLKPDGLVIKSDLDADVFQNLMNSVVEGSYYFSEQITTLIKNFNGNDNRFLDSSDLKILYHLSKGELMKNLPNVVPLSLATIERRKKRLKIILGIPFGSDRELLEISKDMGFI